MHQERPRKRVLRQVLSVSGFGVMLRRNQIVQTQESNSIYPCGQQEKSLSHPLYSATRHINCARRVAALQRIVERNDMGLAGRERGLQCCEKFLLGRII